MSGNNNQPVPRPSESAPPPILIVAAGGIVSAQPDPNSPDLWNNREDKADFVLFLFFSAQEHFHCQSDL